MIFFFNAIEAQGKITEHGGMGGGEEWETDIREGFQEEERSQLNKWRMKRGCWPLRPSAAWWVCHCTTALH